MADSITYGPVSTNVGADPGSGGTCLVKAGGFELKPGTGVEGNSLGIHTLGLQPLGLTFSPAVLYKVEATMTGGGLRYFDDWYVPVAA